MITVGGAFNVGKHSAMFEEADPFFPSYVTYVEIMDSHGQIRQISDEETSSIDSNDVEFVDSSENEENDPQIKQFDFLNSNTYNSYPQNNFNYEKKTEPVKIDENIEQKKINFDYYKFYENNMDLEKRYKKYIENCFKY